MDFLISTASAQAAGAPQGNPWLQMLPLVLIFVVFYFLLIRPQSKKAKEHREMIAKLANGDEVVTAGGILGKIVDVSDAFVTIEVANGVQLKVQRFQVTQLMPKGTLKGA
jgi:preprotein translocase subunit YajC